MYYVYLLRCADDSLYAGITTDLGRRFAEHNGHGSRGAKYTAARRPVRLVCAWRAADRSAASKLEARLKALTRAEKLLLAEGKSPQRLDLSPYAKLAITPDGRRIPMLFLCYPKCSTCKKARAFLDTHGAVYEFRDITQDIPTQAELRRWQQQSGLPLRRFFNTSGQRYRSLGLSERLPDLQPEEQLTLLASDGMLIRRPILVGSDFVLVGFREAEWQQHM